MAANTDMSVWDGLQYRLKTAANPSDVLMSTEEAASYMGLSANALAVRRHTNTSPKFLKRGNLIRYRKADVDAFLQQSDSSNNEEKEK